MTGDPESVNLLRDQLRQLDETVGYRVDDLRVIGENSGGAAQILGSLFTD